jgi:hypothetical protein
VPTPTLTNDNATRKDPRDLRSRALPMVVAILVAAGHELAAPVFGNQNQYLAHVEGIGPEGDWFVDTRDPYPFFTAVVSAVFHLGGDGGLRLLALVFTLAALAGVYLLASLLGPPGSRAVPTLAMAFVGATLVVVPPGVLPFSGQLMSAFQGVADQYVLSQPGYVQPSVAGTLLLLAAPLWLRRLSGDGGGPWGLVAAWSLTAVACMLHPTYMVVVLVGLGAAWVVDAVGGLWRRRLPAYAALGLTIVAASVLVNPAVLDLAATEDSDSVLSRFAFERIGHHTLWWSWPPVDVWRLLLVVAAAVLVTRLPRGGWSQHRWLSRWMLVCLGVIVVSAVVVDLSRWTTLALLFPWRVSVVLVPVAATVVATWLASRLRSAAQAGSALPWRPCLVAGAAVLAAVGLGGTAGMESPAVTNEPTALVRAVSPSGTGLIPLHLENVRLNAGVSVYVDWKSPPYAADELAEWWRRVDRVREVEQGGSPCDDSWLDEIEWVLWQVHDPLPWCLTGWLEIAASDNWAVLERTAP